MIKIGDKVKVTGFGGIYTTYQKMADLMGSKLFKKNLYPEIMEFEVIEKHKHHSMDEMVYLLKNNEGEFLFTDKESDVEVITHPRTKTEFVKVEYSKSWQAAKDHEERVEFLYRQSDLGDMIKGNNWKAIQSPSEAAQYYFDLYRKVEPEIDEQQEFVDRMLEMLDFNEAYDGNKIVSDMYDNFGFRFKLVE